jgi:hypothetical protein
MRYASLRESIKIGLDRTKKWNEKIGNGCALHRAHLKTHGSRFQLPIISAPVSRFIGLIIMDVGNSRVPVCLQFDRQKLNFQ